MYYIFIWVMNMLNMFVSWVELEEDKGSWSFLFYIIIIVGVVLVNEVNWV